MNQPLGVVNCTNDEYHASEGLSRSNLWTFKQLPYKFWYEKLSGQHEPVKDKEAFILGDLLHSMTLEPHTFNDRYMVMPNIDKRTKAGKELYAQLMLESAGKTLIKPEVMSLSEDMSRALLTNTTVSDLMRDAKMEKSIYWRHEPTGLICKARPDIWQGRIVSDLKSTLDAGYRSFQISAYKYGYFLQAGMIFEALKSIGEPFTDFVNICVEKSKPHAVALYMMDDEAVQFGIDMFHALMERIAICYEKNIWPDYGIQKLTIPNYASMEVQCEQ